MSRSSLIFWPQSMCVDRSRRGRHVGCCSLFRCGVHACNSENEGACYFTFIEGNLEFVFPRRILANRYSESSISDPIGISSKSVYKPTEELTVKCITFQLWGQNKGDQPCHFDRASEFKLLNSITDAVEINIDHNFLHGHHNLGVCHEIFPPNARHSVYGTRF